MKRAVLHNLESLVEGRRKREGGKKKKRKCRSPQRGQTCGSEITIRAIRSQVCSCLYLEIDSSLRREKNGSWISHAKQGKSPISTAGLRMRARVERVGFPTRGIVYFIFNRHSVDILLFLFDQSSRDLLEIRISYPLCLVEKKKWILVQL